MVSACLAISRLSVWLMVMRVLLLLLVLCGAFDCHAALPIDTLPDIRGKYKKVDDAMSKIDGLLDKRDSLGRIRVDTNYLRRTPQRLLLKSRVNASGSDLDVNVRINDVSYHTLLQAQMKYTFSIGASYRGLSLGFAVNPVHLAGKNKDFEFNMNAYGNKMGVDLIYLSANTFRGNVTSSLGEGDIPTGLVKYRMLTANAYYAFNSRRFSYPAAFTQSWIQRRSSGSFMLGVSFMGGDIHVVSNEQLGNQDTKIELVSAGVGAGYGYNFVLPRQWLIHVSSLPEIVVFTRSRMTTGEAREKMPYRFPNLMAVGRIAVVKHYEKYFLGMTTVVNTFQIGDYDRLQIGNVKWRARLFFGIKLY